MLVFEERGKPEHPEKNLSEQGREPTRRVARKEDTFGRYRKKKTKCIHNSTACNASFSLVLLLFVGCFLAKKSMPKEKFGSSSLVSSTDYRKVQQQELAA